MTLGSFRKYQADDYLMMLALCFYTTLIPTINIVRDSSSNLLPPNFDVKDLTKQDIKDRQYGSKLILVVEQCQCATIWLVKGCLVLLYLRLTTARKENIAIKILAAYVVVTFIVMDSLYLGYWCQPFHNYWAVPTPNRQCDAATNHLILNAVFNLTSDCAMIAIGLPMFLRLSLPLRKKIPLIGVFSLGVFTIVAAILNKVYSFSQPFGSQWTYWYTRESSTALLVANLPFVWTIWRRITGGDRMHGQSRTNSGTLEGVNRTHNGTAVTNESKSKSPKLGHRFKLRRNSVAELEMDEVPSPRPGGSMTLAEILGGDPVSTIGEEEPNEITHPYLYHTKKQTGLADNNKSSMEKAVLNDSPELQTIRRNSSNPDLQAGDTPASSVFPYLESKTSANSLV
jgi:hypothetical protein